ncbi:hypothetical protein S1OALGB6SA_1077 [Olavius algarvensis spirochete endosymbiont]|nr:MAG: hypothetical protein [Olavius algarvensis spirochete endosymbiont]VDB00004.1 hypothetical protein S1OALGB6SA_1077 [Olavius algarvensis spirochete endosymbiont]
MENSPCAERGFPEPELETLEESDRVDYILTRYVELMPYFLLKRSTRPVVSTNFCLPVKNG